MTPALRMFREVEELQRDNPALAAEMGFTAPRRATQAVIINAAGTAVVRFTTTDGNIMVALGKVGSSVSGKKIVDRALAKSGILAGPFLRYSWEQSGDTDDAS